MRSFLLGAAVVALTACAKGGEAPEQEAVSDKVEIGHPMPAYSASTMAGDSVSLSGLRDKVVLLNVWATWCGPCRQEIPELRAIHSAYKGRGLELIGVTVDADGSDAAVQDFAKEFKMDYAIWRDPNDFASAAFKLAGLPATFLIDRKGILRWKATGAVQPGDTSLTRAIEAALK
jgi:thiol-disulfide isomerase/thioredoxin